MASNASVPPTLPSFGKGSRGGGTIPDRSASRRDDKHLRQQRAAFLHQLQEALLSPGRYFHLVYQPQFDQMILKRGDHHAAAVERLAGQQGTAAAGALTIKLNADGPVAGGRPGG